MGHGIIPYAELISGLVCLVLALVVYRPMKRYYANHSTIARNDEFLVVLWLVLVIFSITMLVYSVT